MVPGVDFNDLKNQGHFIQYGWEEFAHFAYSQYLSKGKGAVFIDLKTMTVTEADDIAVYVEGVAEYKTAKELFARPDDAVSMYDPDIDVAFVFDHTPHPGEPEHMYRNEVSASIATLPTPKQIFESRNTVLEAPLHFSFNVVFAPPVVDFRDKALQEKFVDESWIGLASFAYDNYTKHGRGALVIDLSKVISARKHTTTKVNLPIQYVEISSPKLTQYNDPNLIQMIKDYNPENEVVFIFPHGKADDKRMMEINAYVFPAPLPQMSPKVLSEAHKNIQ